MKVLTALPLTLLLFVNLSNKLYSQTPVVEWQKCLGGKNGDYSWSIEVTSDGGYITAGYTEGPDDGDIMGYHGNPFINDIWLVRLNSDGSTRWQKCLGGLYMETGASVHQTPDGGFIVAGSSASRDCDITGNHGGLDYWVVKLNDKGDIQWQKMYGGSQNEYAYGISLTNDGGYVLAGFTESSNGDITVNHGGRDFWLVKLDGSGNLVWQKSLGGSGSEEAYSVQATADGGCIAAGFTESADGDVTGNHGGRDYWVVKLSGAGSLQWQKCLGGSNADVAWSVQPTKDNGYIVAGASGSDDGDVSGNHGGGVASTDYWVIKLGSAGNILWQKCYGGDRNEIAYFINTTPDGGYVIGGSAESANGDATCNSGLTDMWVVKISSTSNLEWQKSMGGSYYEEAHAVQALSDGSYIIAGITCSSNIAGYHPHSGFAGSCGDFWIVKLTAPVAVPPAPKVIISPASGNICPGVNATFTASALYCGTSPTYQWRKNGIAVGTNSASYTSPALTNGDILSCTVARGGPCETGIALQGVATVVINASNQVINPRVNIVADNTFICNCTTITCKATVTNGGVSPVYQWKVNGVNSGNNGDVFIARSLKAGDVVTCTYTDNSGCLANGAVTSNAITFSGGISVVPALTITAMQNPVCEGTPVSFTAITVNAGASPSYQWKVNGANAGNGQSGFSSASLQNGDIVSCTLITDPSFACAATPTANSNPVTVAITKKATPSVEINTAADTVCKGIPARFTATTANAGQRPSFQWKINGVNAGSNDSSFASASLADGDVVTCAIVSDPLFPCVTTTAVTSNRIAMTVITTAVPAVAITTSGSAICAGTTISFNATVENAGASPLYQWMVNNSPAGSNLPVYETSTMKNGDRVYCQVIPGKKTCAISPVKSNEIIVTVKSLPFVFIQPADTIVAMGTEVQLSTRISEPAAHYTWSPASLLQPPPSLSPKTVPLTDNTSFTLEVQNAGGCVATAAAVIKVTRLLVMPNAFTPNGDGLNDVFRIPPGALLALSEFSVYDRWGNRIFTTRDIGKGWDGYYKGVKVEPGVYIYIINGFNDKSRVFQKGTVAVVR